MLHYHLPILILVDILMVNERHDLLSQFSAKRMDAESSVLNTLIFGLNNKYTFSLPINSNSNCGRDTESPLLPQGSKTSISVPLVAIDPYPHHVVAAVRLLQQTIDKDFVEGKICADAYRNLSSTLTETAQCLPASSQAVQVVKAEISAQMMCE